MDKIPTYFWLGKDGTPQLRLHRHANLVGEIQVDNSVKLVWKEWLYYPIDHSISHSGGVSEL